MWCASSPTRLPLFLRKRASAHIHTHIHTTLTHMHIHRTLSTFLSPSPSRSRSRSRSLTRCFLHLLVGLLVDLLVFKSGFLHLLISKSPEETVISFVCLSFRNEGGITTEIGRDTTYTHTHVHTCTHMYTHVRGHCLFSQPIQSLSTATNCCSSAGV